MYRQNNTQMARAQQRLGVPNGARAGVVAGAQGQALVPQRAQRQQAARPQMRAAQNPQIRPSGFPQMPAGLQQMLQVPQGADAGALAGCGDGDCLDIGYAQPWVGYPTEPMPFVQPAALVPIQITLDDAPSTTVQISCGNSLFYGCCARSFNGPGEINILEAFSGANDVDLFCPGSGGLDVNFFNTNGNECCCAFDWGCFSSFFPLIIEFAPISVASPTPFLNFVIGGTRLQGGNACAFWPGLYPGFPGGGALPPSAPVG